ncbi:MAG: tRNA 2-selenouridine(34) synthase MnmH [Gammaproteobacteria bacterium]|nr:MAG: tRNA 2-selenouridine(34) synthase MnmH [Gammaproteobacteria bacterium]PIE36812.1 MAG: tRNA 2-selenouridine(34) synthase MnmH [Gammaproteobacteria bacterium]
MPQGGGEVIGDALPLLLADRPLVDVRAPVEFRRGAFPAAVNLPLLDDRERHLVGVRYKEAGQDAAIGLGEELLSRSVRQNRLNAWLAELERHPDAVFYCFRGGLRSRLVQQWLGDAGAAVPIIRGGYKALRRRCIDTLANDLAASPMLLVGGRTGVGKTAFLSRLSKAASRHGDAGFIDLDLEGLARHRGSSFGGIETEQPGNVDFEHALVIDWLRRGGQGRALVLEDEAKTIGRVAMPEALKLAMQQAPIALLEASLEARIENCLDDYVRDLLARFQSRDGEAAGFEVYAEHHRGALARIRKRLGGLRHDEASQHLEVALAAHRRGEGVAAYRPFIALLLEHYYDPMYDYQIAGKSARVLASGDAETLLAILPEVIAGLAPAGNAGT